MSYNPTISAEPFKLAAERDWIGKRATKTDKRARRHAWEPTSSYGRAGGVYSCLDILRLERSVFPCWQHASRLVRVLVHVWAVARHPQVVPLHCNGYRLHALGGGGMAPHGEMASYHCQRQTISGEAIHSCNTCYRISRDDSGRGGFRDVGRLVAAVEYWVNLFWCRLKAGGPDNSPNCPGAKHRKVRVA